MPDLPKRLVATTLAAVLVSGLTACGGDSDSAAQPAPDVTASATPVISAEPEAAIVPTSYADAFSGIRGAASHMPMMSAPLAAAIAEDARLKGTVDSDAADLRSSLTHLLVEHVYLTGYLVYMAYTKAPDATETEQARAALDDNSGALASLIAVASSDEDAKVFLKAWDGHVDDFFDYAVAARDGRSTAKQRALAGLTAYRDAAGDFFAGITGNKLRASTVSAALRTHNAGVIEAIDSFAADEGKGDGKGFDKLKLAAGHMTETAEAFAEGIAEAAEVDGDPGDAASELRAEFTAMLTEHTYLAGLAVFTAYTQRQGVTSDLYRAAQQTLEDNSQDLAKAIGAISTSAKQARFLQSWRLHIRDLTDYASAVSKSNDRARIQALDSLDRYRVTAGKFFADITDDAVDADDAADLLVMHIESLAGAIDALADTLIG